MQDRTGDINRKGRGYSRIGQGDTDRIGQGDIDRIGQGEIDRIGRFTSDILV